VTTNWILEINDKDLTLGETNILRIVKESGGIDYFNLRDYFRDKSDEEFREILKTISKLINMRLLQLTEDKNGRIWIKEGGVSG